MTLPTNANPLPPPPVTGDRRLDAWNRELYKKLGEANVEAPIKSENITGVLESANAAVNIAKNVTNDAVADSIDAGSDATIRVYGPGGVGSNWNFYRNGALVATYSAVTFTGKSYTTTYYIGFNVNTLAWICSTQYKDVTGDNMIMFAVATVAGGGGGGTPGGGGSGDGGYGGGGFGMFS